MNIDDITDAYFPVSDAGQKVIVPHVAVLMSYNENKEKKSREAFLSLRAEDWGNMADEDLQVIKSFNK